MEKVTVTDTIKFIGVNDYDIRLFEGQYVVPNGMSYNSYLIDDEKIAIMDTVDKRATDEWVKNLERELSSESLLTKRWFLIYEINYYKLKHKNTSNQRLDQRFIPKQKQKAKN